MKTLSKQAAMEAKKKQMFRPWIICGILVVLFVAGFGAFTATNAGGVVLIASDEVSDDSLSKSEVKDMFLGKKNKWNSDQVVVLSVLRGGNVHEEFCQEYTGKTASQFDAYWKSLVFTGRASMPRSFKSEEDLVKYVSITKGAIGYVGSSAR